MVTHVEVANAMIPISSVTVVIAEWQLKVEPREINTINGADRYCNHIVSMFRRCSAHLFSCGRIRRPQMDWRRRSSVCESSKFRSAESPQFHKKIFAMSRGPWRKVEHDPPCTPYITSTLQNKTGHSYSYSHGTWLTIWDHTVLYHAAQCSIIRVL